uniref:Uncharacterized protein n=1 Tax=Manihot esculenta TaxID=3983 RepID=A0A2C9U2W6_MANES
MVPTPILTVGQVSLHLTAIGNMDMIQLFEKLYNKS